MTIHPLADVSAEAQIGKRVSIGAFCVVEAGTVIGDDCELAPRASIKRGTIVGNDNYVGEGAVLGGLPQHLHQPEQIGTLKIGDRNVIRENATLHRAMHHDAATTLGDDCMLMVSAHVAHDCVIGNHVVLTNNVMLAGHVTVGDRAYLGGGVAVHQHCRIGRIAMVGGLARVDQDVAPFVMVEGDSHHVVGLNRVGLRRAGLDASTRAEIKIAYRHIFHEQHSLEELVELLRNEFPEGPASEYADFFAGTTRGFMRERRRMGRATLRLISGDEHQERREAA